MEAPPSGRPRLAALAALAVACATLTFVHAQDATAPWGVGFRAINAGGYYGAFVQNYVRYGGAAVGYANVFVHVPATPPIAQPYFNHPQLYGWIQWAAAETFGSTEATIRRVAYVFALWGLLGVFLVARRLGGDVAAGAVALVYAAGPAGGFWGLMPSHESACTAAAAWAYLAYLRWADRPGAARAAVFAGAFGLGCALDWSAYGVAVVVVLHAWTTRSFGAAVRTGLVATAAALVAAGGHLAHASAFLGDFRAALGAMGFLGGVSVAGAQGTPVFLPGALREAVVCHGPGWLVAAVCGGVATARRGGAHRGAALFGAFALLPGAMYLLAFRGHAKLHEFWTMTAAPGVALLVGCGAAAAAEGLRLGRPAVVRGLAAAALVACGALGVRDAVENADRAALERSDFFRELGTAVRERLPADAVVMTNADWYRVGYYLERPMLMAELDAASIGLARAMALARGLDPARLFFVADLAKTPPEGLAALAPFGDPVRVGGVAMFRCR
jgi:4-amino-4-deoxy-L-arabinose transferase-like glycosyltransferase